MQPQNDLTSRTRTHTHHKQNNKSALSYMLVTVLVFSGYPFIFALGNASAAPFLFVGLMNLSSFITGLVFLIWFHHSKRQTQTIKETSAAIYSKIFTKEFFLVLMSRFQGVFFAMSLAHISVAVASILTSAKPLIMAFSTSLLFKKVGRYQKITKEKWLLFVFAFIGAGFVAASQSESFVDIAGDLLSQGAIIGISLVLLSTLVGGVGESQSLKLGNDISKKTAGGSSDELFFAMAIWIIPWLIAAPVFITLGYISNETLSDINIYPAIIYGSVALGGSILSRLAYIKTANLGVAAIRYLTPIVALAWLGVFSLINVPHFDWLVIGASAIIIANLLLNFKTNIRPTLKALIIVLWLSATVAYLISA